jgi:hypothetical protein
MKTIKQGLAFGLLILLSACAFYQKAPITLQPVGPSPNEASVSRHEGCLVVYSDWAVDANANRHSQYAVVSDDGKVNQQVRNSINRFEQGPTPINLPAGSYKVTAQAAHYGKVIVPVRIRSDQTTFVYLDGYDHTGKSLAANTNMVRLPNGNVVGWADAGNVN